MISRFWKSKYFEKTAKESHINVFRSLEIKNYLKQIFKNYNFNLHDYSLAFSNTTLNIFLSAHKKMAENQQASKNKNQAEFIKIRNAIKKYYINSQSTSTASKNIKYLSALNLYKHATQATNKSSTFSQKLIAHLNEYTKNKLHLKLTLQLADSINLEQGAKRIPPQLQEFQKKEDYFFEMMELLIVINIYKDSSGLLASFIAKQLEKTKRHNILLKNLKEKLKQAVCQKFSRIQGIKILINGRLNNAPRSRNVFMKLGKTPLISSDTKISYSEATSFTKNGTFGVKIWVCEKELKNVGK